MANAPQLGFGLEKKHSGGIATSTVSHDSIVGVRRSWKFS